jgi:hypothetical protein
VYIVDTNGTRFKHHIYLLCVCLGDLIDVQ